MTLPWSAVVVALLSAAAAAAEDEDPMKGWRMVDRFDGFRYEVPNTGLTVDSIVAKADDLACFGWVQVSTGREPATLVGEGRCNKRAGPLFREWLTSQSGLSAQGSTSAFKVYADTKIKLHFSHFKVLPPERLTCFRDEPHQCAPGVLGDPPPQPPPERPAPDAEADGRSDGTRDKEEL